MHRDSMFELRILSGTHAGARVLLSEASQSLGSAIECDLILSDEGVLACHVQIAPEGDGRFRLSWPAGDLPPLTLRSGEATRVGSVQVAIEQADAPWRTDLPVQEPPLAVQDGDATPASEHAAASLQEDRPAAPSQPQGRQGLQGLLARLRGRLGRTVAVLALLALALVLAGALAGWQALRQGRPPVSVAKPPLPPAAGSPQEPVQAVLARLGFASRVRVETGTDGLPVVHARFLSEDDAEALAAALSRLVPRPGLHLASEEDMQASVTDAVQRIAQAAGITGTVTSQYLGGGRFHLEGQVANDTQRDSLLSQLSRDFPEVVAIDSGLVTDAEVAANMVEDLRRLRVGEISGDWNGKLLDMEVRLREAQIPRWEAALVSVARRYPMPFRAQLLLAAQRPAEPTPVLPFQVRTVVGGELGYVVLGDGRRLVSGGMADGWRVADIRTNAVMFEDARGRRLTLER